MKIDFNNLIHNILEKLHKEDIRSIIIEGGNKTLQSFINSNLWDEARIFTSNINLKSGINAPIIKGNIISKSEIDTDSLKTIIND